METTNKKCAHPGCECAVTGDNKYCSPYCSDAGDTLEISCNCGHTGCAVGEGAPSMTARG